jgi:hypothetical protein
MGPARDEMGRRRRIGALSRRFAAAACLATTFAAGTASAGMLDRFEDPQTGEFDLSDWLLDRKGFLPVPLIITEPAFGYGGGVGLLFFRQSMKEAAEASKDTGHVTPPDIYALAGAGTSNGTWVGGGGGMVTFADDTWRWRGGVVRMSPNLTFYGDGDPPVALGYNLDGWASVQNVMMRLGQSEAWLVGSWTYLDAASRFDSESQAAQLGAIDRASRMSGLGIGLEYDSRDNIFTPSRGLKGNIEGNFYSPSIGSDTEFQSYRAHGFGYWPVAKSLVLAGRFDARVASGKVPFYALPYIDLRGVPVMRLQDTHTGVVETEARWNLTHRWALVGFLGAGRAWGARTDFSGGQKTLAEGVGFRYLVASRLGMYAGIDWAHSTQDHAFYIQIGNAWR